MALLGIQLGHCYRKRGVTGAPGEQGFADSVGRKLAARAVAVGIPARIILADPADSAYRGLTWFVAIHYDGNNNSSVRGASVGYQTNAGRDLAHKWKALYQRYGWPSGFRADNYTSGLAGYYGVREARQAGCSRAFIIEAGFGSNPTDRAWMNSHHDTIAQSLLDTIRGTVSGVPDNPLPYAGGLMPLTPNSPLEEIRHLQYDMDKAATLINWGGYPHLNDYDGKWGDKTAMNVLHWQARLFNAPGGIDGAYVGEAFQRRLAAILSLAHVAGFTYTRAQISAGDRKARDEAISGAVDRAAQRDADVLETVEGWIHTRDERIEGVAQAAAKELATHAAGPHGGDPDPELVSAAVRAEVDGLVPDLRVIRQEAAETGAVDVTP